MEPVGEAVAATRRSENALTRLPSRRPPGHPPSRHVSARQRGFCPHHQLRHASEISVAGDDPVNEGDPSGKDPCLQQFSLTGALLTIGTHTPDALPPPGPIQIPPLSSWPAVASFCGDWACLVYQENLSTRSVQWGFVMYIPLSGFGEWDIYVLLNGAVFNQKHQWYTPHGSLPGKVLKPGDEISIIGEEYVGVGVAQVMPNLFTVR